MATARIQNERSLPWRNRQRAPRRREADRTPDDIWVELLEVEVQARKLVNVAYKLAMFWACVFAALTVLLVVRAAYSPQHAQTILPLVTGPSGLASAAIAWVAGRRMRSPIAEGLGSAPEGGP
jgi:hypothetical protein